ncbi:GPW/gp25 family protein [Dyadobacter bucti]|jgi:phage baseplate assembly protein W|uniref:GPW/gp25 family protein n=1 Tax=Dyadobacter bucti TaxID=2572203 RepID=UPI001108D678|nr:GPW/gp25 family protein [Dyadobacter bucti]
MENSKNSFLGKGWAFPPAFNIATGTVDMVRDEEDIRQSLYILLSTSLGERVMQPDYGCNLNDYVFEGLSSSTIGYIKERVANSILYYEPRIVVDKIEVTSAGSSDNLEGNFLIDISYSIPGTNSRFNYVYNFYKNEAVKPI